MWVPDLFPTTLRRKDLKTQQSPVILELSLSLKKPLSEQSHDYYDFIVFEKLPSQNVFRPHYTNAKPAFSNFSGLKSVFKKFRFHDGLVWTEVNKAAFSIFFDAV